MRENAEQSNSKYGHFLRSEFVRLYFEVRWLFSNYFLNTPKVVV